jgi:hypothetical protein
LELDYQYPFVQTGLMHFFWLESSVLDQDHSQKNLIDLAAKE